VSSLPDILAPSLHVVICGTAAGERSAERRDYYAGPGNDFWRLLYLSGLTPRQLDPDEDANLPNYGIGLTDLNKTVAQNNDRGLTYDVPGLLAKVDTYRPTWIAFHGLTAARAVVRKQPLGLASWQLGPARVFVLPSASGANRSADNATPDRLGWWRKFADMVREN
jgi:TDG/mug DNA glycosylase family protein